MKDNEDKEVRDMFAAFALQAIISDGKPHSLCAAKEAFEYADAMMKEREKTE